MLKANRKHTALFLLLPAVIVIFVIVIYPFIYSLYTSFHFWYLASLAGKKFIGLKNYIDILTDSEIYHSIKLTIIFFGVTLSGQMLLGTGLGFLMDNNYLKFRKIFRSLLIIPMMMAPAVVSTVWRMMYNPTYGILTYIASRLGIKDIGWIQKPALAIYSLSLVEIWQWAPFVALIILAGLQTLQKDLLDAARVDGASGFQLFRYIKLPLMRPYIALAFLMRLIFSFRAFESFRIITRGGPGTSTEVIMLKLYLKGFQYMRIGYASALAFLILIVIIIITTFSFNWLFPSTQKGGE